MKISELKFNLNNPREIPESAIKKAKKSIKEFSKMLSLRPLIIDDDGTVLGGNIRLKALIELGYDEIPDEWVRHASDLTEEEKKRFIIVDNLPLGDWDWVKLESEWDKSLLHEWGLDTPTLRPTEQLSEIKIRSIYYEPKNKPNINLKDCIDFTKYNKKLEIINKSQIDENKKEILRLLAVRFLKVDFEAIANYYSFNASEEEKRVIERLRLVLIDNGEKGFIEDELLKIKNAILAEELKENE